MTWLIYALASVGAIIVNRWLLKPVGGNILKPFGRMPTNGH